MWHRVWLRAHCTQQRTNCSWDAPRSSIHKVQGKQCAPYCHWDLPGEEREGSLSVVSVNGSRLVRRWWRFAAATGPWLHDSTMQHRFRADHHQPSEDSKILGPGLKWKGKPPLRSCCCFHLEVRVSIDVQGLQAKPMLHESPYRSPYSVTALCATVNNCDHLELPANMRASG